MLSMATLSWIRGAEPEAASHIILCTMPVNTIDLHLSESDGIVSWFVMTYYDIPWKTSYFRHEQSPLHQTSDPGKLAKKRKKCQSKMGKYYGIPWLILTHLRIRILTYLRKKWSQNGSTPGAVSWYVNQLHPWHYFGATFKDGAVFV